MKFFVFLFCLISLIARASMASIASNQNHGTLNLVAVIPERATLYSYAIAASAKSSSAPSESGIALKLSSNTAIAGLSISNAAEESNPTPLRFKIFGCKMVPRSGLELGREPLLFAHRAGISDQLNETCYVVPIKTATHLAVRENSKITNSPERIRVEFTAI